MQIRFSTHLSEWERNLGQNNKTEPNTCDGNYYVSRGGCKILTSVWLCTAVQIEKSRMRKPHKVDGENLLIMLYKNTMCIPGYLKTNVSSRIFKLGAGMFWNVVSVARLGTRSGESQRVAISGQRFVLTRCQVFFPLNLVSFIVSFSLSLQVCTKTIVVSLLRGVSNMWSLLFVSSLAIFYKSLSPHAELEGLMAELARAVIYTQSP